MLVASLYFWTDRFIDPHTFLVWAAMLAAMWPRVKCVWVSLGLLWAEFRPAHETMSSNLLTCFYMSIFPPLTHAPSWIASLNRKTGYNPSSNSQNHCKSLSSFIWRGSWLAKSSNGTYFVNDLHLISYSLSLTSPTLSFISSSSVIFHRHEEGAW